MRIVFILVISSILQVDFALAESTCTTIKNPDHTNSHSKFNIRESGTYCLIENLDSRLDFADHRTESRLIYILASDVVLDLQNHTLGRGKYFRDPGGFGIGIYESSNNITIKNGTLQDFEAGIVRIVPSSSGSKKKNS